MINGPRGVGARTRQRVEALLRDHGYRRPLTATATPLTAARHLLDLGHRRIGLLTGPVRDLSARARLDGFWAALDHAGVAHDEGLERRGVFTFDDGVALGAELLALPDRPTAVMCGDDLQALGVYEAARRAGLRPGHRTDRRTPTSVRHDQGCVTRVPTIAGTGCVRGRAVQRVVGRGRPVLWRPRCARDRGRVPGASTPQVPSRAGVGPRRCSGRTATRSRPESAGRRSTAPR